MSTEPISDKDLCRKRLRAALQAIPPEDRAVAAALACELLRQQAAWQRARTVLFYAATGKELDLAPLLREALQTGKKVALPCFNAATGTYEAVSISNFERDCAPGKFGIAEPGRHRPLVALNLLDLALVPGLGFDASGSRLGRGRGFYDRLLARMAGAKCGVAFDQQVVPQIPAGPDDINMNFILTPTRWLEISGRSADKT